jgi:hypothetical protein
MPINMAQVTQKKKNQPESLLCVPGCGFSLKDNCHQFRGIFDLGLFILTPL